ncbi:MAG: alanine racemase [Candidatus Bathyarchaeota archaeon]|nr:alanine racemase [Candidatus Bathyarchaeota archaeon]
MIPEVHGIRPVWVEVDLDNLAHNMRETRRVTDAPLIMAAVKADGYGHGAPNVAKVFLDNGADRLATANIDEAIQLRRHGFEAPILVLGYIPEYLYPKMLASDVTPTIYSVEQAEALSSAVAEAGVEAKFHVKLDTGMRLHRQSIGSHFFS